MVRTTIQKLVVPLAAFAMLASIVVAQPGPGGQGGGQQGGPGGQGRPPMQMGGPMLLLRPDVGTELKLTDQQKQAIQEVVRPPRGGGQGGPGQGGPGGPPPGGGQGGDDHQGPPPGGGQGGGEFGGPPPGGQGGDHQGPPPQDGRGKQIEEKIKAILSEGQYKRYHQLALQWDGPKAIGRPDVAQALNLSEDQLDKVKAIMDDLHEAMQDLLSQQLPREQFEAKRQELENSANGKIIGLLSADQKSKWEAMLGPKFEFKKLPPPNRG